MNKAKQRRIEEAVKVAEKTASGVDDTREIFRSASIFLYEFPTSEYVAAFQEIGTALGIIYFLQTRRPPLAACETWRDTQFSEQRSLIKDRLEFLRTVGELPCPAEHPDN
jgi:hypothetical protein